MSVLIGLHIKRTLERDKGIAGVVGNRIFPVAMAQGVETYPFICYDTNGGSGQRTKDGALNDVSTVGMAVVAKSYEGALELANMVRKSFEGKRAKYEELEAECVGLTYNDEYIDSLDAFAVNMSVDFKTKDL